MSSNETLTVGYCLNNYITMAFARDANSPETTDDFLCYSDQYENRTSFHIRLYFVPLTLQKTGEQIPWVSSSRGSCDTAKILNELHKECEMEESSAKTAP